MKATRLSFLKKYGVLLWCILGQLEASSNRPLGESFYTSVVQQGLTFQLCAYPFSVAKEGNRSSSYTLTDFFLYAQSFNAYELAQYFWFNGRDVMHFGPAQDGTTVYSYNFLLGGDFESDLKASPIVQTALNNVCFFAELDSLVSGLYVALCVPLVYQRTDMRLTESGIQPAVIDPAYLIADVG